MKLKNDFSEQDRSWFLDNYECWICGKNKWDALHHVKGRGIGDSKVESSILNAAPVCNFTCHLGRHFTEEENKIMLQKTLRWLLKKGYQLTNKDEQFILQYMKYY